MLVTGGLLFSDLQKRELCHVSILLVIDQSLFGSYFEVPLRFGLVDNTVWTVILHGAFLALKT